MIPLSRRVLTPRTPGGWALFIGRIAAAVLLVLVTLGACVWAFFGQDAFMAYLAVAVFAFNCRRVRYLRGGILPRPPHQGAERRIRHERPSTVPAG